MTNTTDSDDAVELTPPPRPAGRRAAVIGAGAGLAALAAGLAAASFVAAVAGVAGPVESVGNRFVDGAPLWLKEWAIDTFGTNDKPVLVSGVFIALVVLAMAAGRLAMRRWRIALLGVLAVGALGIAAAVTRTGSRGADWLPPLIGALVASGVLSILVRTSRPRPVEPAAVTSPIVTEYPTTHDRRRFLVQAGIAGLSAAGVAGLARAVRGQHTRTVRTAAAQRSLPTPKSAAAPVAPTATAPGGVEPYLTPNADFYRIDTGLSTPVVNPDTWRLKITGMVGNPIELSYDDLLARPMIERVVTLTCVSNDIGGNLIGTARFLGVPLADLLHEAKVQTGATQVASESVDGWTCGFPTAIALDGRDALVAVGMNGEPLPPDHGYPARLVVPGLYGYVSATKWLKEIRLTTWEDFDGYWVPRGWSKEGPIKTQSRIDVPRRGAKLVAGRNAVAGVAWAQHRGVTKVEVRVDDGAWQQTTLADQPTVDGWRQWSFAWDATAGGHTLWVRATDATGATQIEQVSDVAPNGATGWHSVRVNVT